MDEPEIFDVLLELQKLPLAFDQLIKLIRIAISLPVSTASNERFFSILKRVKTYLRQTCGDERLSDLLLINIESDLVSKFDTQKLIDEFGRMKVRRYPVL